MTTQHETFDIIILGAGPSGVAAAEAAAMRGRTVALISDGKLMGYGLEGAFKSKSLYEIARAHHAVHHRFHLAEGGYDIDHGAMREAHDDGAEELREVHRRQLQGLGVHIVHGRGRFVDTHTIAVGARQLRGERMLIATGTRPRTLPGMEPDGRYILTSDEIVDVDHRLDSLLVLGAGVIGCEFASFFAAFGTRVTLVDSKDRIFSHDDEDVSALLEHSFERFGMDVRRNARCQSMTVVDGQVHTRIGEETIVTSAALLAIGRIPNSDDLGLEAAGVACDKRGYISTDDTTRTNVPHIYAVGDIGLRDTEHDLCLVHVGEAEGRCAVGQILGDEGPLETSYVPFIIFTLPMVAGAGFGEAEARRRFGEVRVGKWANIRNHRSHAMQSRKGFVKLIVGPAGDDRVLGVRAVGEGVDTVVGEVSVLIRHGLPYTHVCTATHAHPSLDESLQGAARIVDGTAPAYVPGEEWGDRPHS